MFFGRPKSTFCGIECSHAARRQPIHRTCKQCSKEFFVNQRRIDDGGGVFCSRTCSDEGQKRQLPASTCQCCGKVFTHKHSNLRERKYCSKACAAKAIRGVSKKSNDGRGNDHDKWRLAVILRDKKCMRCGAVDNLQAHHLKTWKSHPELRYEVSNGVSLCPFCHHAQHPKLPLERFVASGGKKVQYCVICETAFLVKKKTQRVCSIKCGWSRKQQNAAMQRGSA